MCNSIGTRWGQPTTAIIPFRRTVKTLSVVQRKQRKIAIKTMSVVLKANEINTFLTEFFGTKVNNFVE